MGLQDKKIQVEVMGFVRTEIIDSRSTFSFSADADKWFALPDEAKEQRAKSAMLKALSWHYEVLPAAGKVHIQGEVCTNAVNSGTSFEETLPLDEWREMSEYERDEAIANAILESGAVEWSYTSPVVNQSRRVL